VVSPRFGGGITDGRGRDRSIGAGGSLAAAPALAGPCPVAGKPRRVRMRVRALGLAWLLIVSLAVAGLGEVAAQGDEVFGDLTSIPELTITLTDGGLAGVPAETPAGWTLVTFTNDVTPTGDPFEDSWSIEVLQLPEDKTVDDLAAALTALLEGGGPPADEEAGADAASPPAAPEEDPFAWALAAFQPGGPGALQGQTTQGLIDLPAGNYGVLVFGPFAPVPLTVVEGDAAPSDPGTAVAADVVITETGTSGSFDFSVETGDFAGGPAVVQVVNESDQPHFVIGIRSAVALAEEQVMALLMSDEGGTPPPGAPDPSQLAPGFITGTQSPGTTQYLALNLEAGYYALLCFVGDPAMGGVPHSFAGMIEVVPIGV
jgi:hypothetical protein